MSGKVIAVANSKGGVGKSTAAANIAIDAANKGLNVLLCDAEKDGTMMDYEHRESDNLTVMNAYEKAFPKMLDMYRNNYDLVVIDTAGSNANMDGDDDNFQEVLNRKIFCKCDLMLIPIEPSPVTVRKSIRFLQAVDDYVDASRGQMQALVFINKAKLGQKQTREMQHHFAKHITVPVSKNLIREAVDMRYAEAEFKSVNEFAPKSDVALDMRLLQKEVFTMLGLEG